MSYESYCKNLINALGILAYTSGNFHIKYSSMWTFCLKKSRKTTGLEYILREHEGLMESVTFTLTVVC